MAYGLMAKYWTRRKLSSSCSFITYGLILNIMFFSFCCWCHWYENTIYPAQLIFWERWLLLTPSILQMLLFCSVQSLSHVCLFATPWTEAHQSSLSITNSRNVLKLMSIESVMPSNHLILCHPLLLPPPILSSIRVCSNESVLRIRWPKYWSFSFSISPSNEYSRLISFRMD